MKKYKLITCAFLLFLSSLLLGGCFIDTDIKNAEFAKHMITGKYTNSNPPKVTFEDHNYIISNEKVKKGDLKKRVGVVDKDNTTSYWIWTLKNESQSEAIGLYINNMYYIARSEN